MNILIIEDDVFLASKLQEVFQQNVVINRIDRAHSYEEYLHQIDNINSYDIILTDIVLSEEEGAKDGIDILRYIRSQSLTVPIIIISSLSSYESLENAFRVGATDYIIKPFRLRELEIRVNRWFQEYVFSTYYSQSKMITYAGIEYDLWSREFCYNGQKMWLTKSHKYILSLFVMYAETLVANDFLIKKIWGDNDVEHNRNPRVSILRLKKSLEEYGIQDWIQSVRWEWYIFRKPN